MSARLTTGKAHHERRSEESGIPATAIDGDGCAEPSRVVFRQQPITREEPCGSLCGSAGEGSAETLGPLPQALPSAQAAGGANGPELLWMGSL